MAAHVVEKHLGVSATDYGAAIARLVPHYEEALAVAADAVMEHLRQQPGALRVVELGAGTGRLTGLLAERLPAARFKAVDCDPAMLATARARLADCAPRVRFVEARFEAGLPASGCEAVVASLALHHVRALADKTALYRKIRNALTPGGIFVNADAAVPAVGAARERVFDAWISHQIGAGIPTAEARENLARWQREEDKYFALEEELSALAEAGFRSLDVVWRRGPMAVLLAVREP